MKRGAETKASRKGGLLEECREPLDIFTVTVIDRNAAVPVELKLFADTIVPFEMYSGLLEKNICPTVAVARRCGERACQILDPPDSGPATATIGQLI